MPTDTPARLLRPADPSIWWANVARHLDYRGRLAGIAAPALVIVGRYDPRTPVACAEELAAGLPHACLRRVERSGHYPFIEEPERFRAEVGTSLESPAEPARAEGPGDIVPGSRHEEH